MGRMPQANSDSQAAAPAPRLALHWKILIGLVLGGAAGLVAAAVLPAGAPAAPGSPAGPNPQLEWFITHVAVPLGQVFLRLVFMVVVPLVFCALVLGVVELGNLRSIGRIGVRTLAYTLVFSTISVLIAIGLTRSVRPGESLPEEKRIELRDRFLGDAEQTVAQARSAKSLTQTLLDIIPRNPLQEMVGALDGSSPGGGMLAVMFFALAFGLAVAAVPERSGPLLRTIEGVYDAVMVIVGFAMQLAPYCVAGLAFALTARLGLDILTTLGAYVLTVLVGLGLHLLIVYGLALSLLARRNPWTFFRDASAATMTAFATSSSNATLPTSLRVAEHDLKLTPSVGRFVLTVGATANQNGTALYEGVTVLFLAQVFGVDLTLADQVKVALLCVLAGIGTAGVPGGSLPLVVLVLQSVNIPAEGIGIILGVDRLLDMCRTSLNVAGDLTIAACVDRGQAPQQPPQLAGSAGGAG